MTRKTRKSWLSCVIFVAVVTGKEIYGEENVSDAIRSLREQVNALLDHRQQDYNALEESLKRAIEKNTELYVLKNEIKQLRKEVISLRGGGNGNEAKNERLRIRWLGSAVTELQGEIAEVLRTRNASEELAERSGMKSEVTLLKGDVAAVGRGIRNLGGRIAKIEAVLGTIRLDITAVKERFSLLSRTCADIASQLSSIQMEVKSLKCDSSSVNAENSMIRAVGVEEYLDGKTGGKEGVVRGRRRRVTRKRGYSKRSEGHRARLEVRLKSLERKVILMTQGKASLEKRVATYENENENENENEDEGEGESEECSGLSKRIKSLERGEVELSRKISNVSETASSQLIESLKTLRNAIERNNSSTKRELTRLGVNVARKAAELSLTREELSNLRRTVQALSVSASKLQEKSEREEEAIDRLNGIYSTADFHRFPATNPRGSSRSVISSNEIERNSRGGENGSEEVKMGCDERTGNEPTTDGLKLLERGKGGRPMLVFCREGWIVIARRIDGTLDFDRNWTDYSLGFGSPVSEYWIGNEILHELTRDNCTGLRIDMLDIYGERWRAEYRSFTVDSEETGYRLRVHGYSGNATDALSYQNGMAFSAKDRDMDASTTHCARNYHGGWWFSRCQHANLNAKYTLGLTWFRSDTNRWMSIAFSEMSLRRNPYCRSRQR